MLSYWLKGHGYDVVRALMENKQLTFGVNAADLVSGRPDA